MEWQSRLHAINPSTGGWPGWTWKLPLLLVVLVFIPLILVLGVVAITALLVFFLLRLVFRLVALLFGAGPGRRTAPAAAPADDGRQNVRVLARDEE